MLGGVQGMNKTYYVCNVSPQWTSGILCGRVMGALIICTEEVCLWKSVSTPNICGLEKHGGVCGKIRNLSGDFFALKFYPGVHDILLRKQQTDFLSPLVLLLLVTDTCKAWETVQLKGQLWGKAYAFQAEVCVEKFRPAFMLENLKSHIAVPLILCWNGRSGWNDQQNTLYLRREQCIFAPNVVGNIYFPPGGRCRDETDGLVYGGEHRADPMYAYDGWQM